ncbi:MAG: hypothetical protein M1834_006942 [Cirrosporium novae-zelandiae]|nr:MAG: hypothetical protein M1834_006942 [Cirrosporium novae-zelandiae]
MARSKSIHQTIEDSWTDNFDADEDGYSSISTDESRNSIPSRRQQRYHNITSSCHSTKGFKSRPTPSNNTRIEPELIMPSMHEDLVFSSWMNPNNQDPTMSPRKRNIQSPFRQSIPLDRRPQRRDQTFHPANDVSYGDITKKSLEASFIFVFDILGRVLKLLKIPISLLLALYLLSGIVVFLGSLLFQPWYQAITPICRFPGTSSLSICRSKVNYPGDHPPTPQFDEVMEIQSKFGEILEEAADRVTLPMVMKRGEVSIRDLRQVVRFSSLPSKNALITEFDGFIESARTASYDLGSFNGHVGRTVDNLLNIARWTRRLIDNIALEEANRGVIQTYVDSVFAPFLPIRLTEDKLLDQYIRHTEDSKNEIHRLTIEAQSLLMTLKQLEDRLDVINGLAIKDGLETQATKDEILSELWTMLGRNGKRLRRMDKELDILKQVGAYRQMAWNLVATTIVKLQTMEAELQQLRDSVVSAEQAHHLDIPLSIHIANIESGVERLEAVRSKTRETEQKHRKAIREDLENQWKSKTASNPAFGEIGTS